MFRNNLIMRYRGAVTCSHPPHAFPTDDPQRLALRPTNVSRCQHCSMDVAIHTRCLYLWTHRHARDCVCVCLFNWIQFFSMFFLLSLQPVDIVLPLVEYARCRLPREKNSNRWFRCTNQRNRICDDTKWIYCFTSSVCATSVSLDFSTSKVCHNMTNSTSCTQCYDM